MSNIKQLGNKWRSMEKSRQYIQEAVAFANWKKDQEKKRDLGVRTLVDMSEEEILALESQYGCPVKRPERKRRKFSADYTIVAVKVDTGEGWVGMIEEQPGIKVWRPTWEEALDAAQGYVETSGFTLDEDGNRVDFEAA